MKNWAVGITGLLLAASPLQALAFTPAERNAALEKVAGLIADNYVYTDKSAEIALAMLDWENDPAFIAVDNELLFASLLSERLQAYDAHFSISWSDPTKVDSAPSRLKESDESYADRIRRDNYGFQEVERLDGNIGYLRMSSFAWFDRDDDVYQPERHAGESAMAFLQGTDAVIIDLRQNGGGAPSMVHFIFSHFVDEDPMLINTFYERANDQTIEFYSFDKLANKRRPDTPLFVLISGRTSSAAEGFAYHVQTHGVGTVVGETSIGAANPGDMFDAGGGFSVFISTGAAINPVTGTNWEHVGVKPDVEVAAKAALTKAHELALAAVIDKAGASSNATREAEWTLERMRAQSNKVAVRRAQLRHYAGAYGERIITMRDGILIYKRGRRPEQPLVALGNDMFAFKSSSAYRIRFVRNAKGKVNAISLLSTGGSESRYARND